MIGLRFPFAVFLAALALTAAAEAQSAPVPAPAAPVAPPIPLGPARIDDIQVSREGDKVSILVKLSQQPAAASARISDSDLVVEIDGLTLMKLALAPPPGSLVSRVEADGRKLTLSGAALAAASTVIYRNAVLIEARLAEPVLRLGTSLLGPAAAAPTQPSGLESHPAPIAAPGSAAPVAVKPAALAPAAAKPADYTLSTASLAKIDAARCAAAATEVAKDAWAVAALGDHALCLLDAGKPKEAKERLDQLAAFAPDDWRVALGNAGLAGAKGDAAKAQDGYRVAARLAPDDAIRAAITAKIEPAPAHN
jgi:hypothetical protein